MLFCDFWEIFNKTFFKEPFGRLLLHKHSFCLLSQHDHVPFQKRCHTYFPAEYFLGSICRLRTRASSIFQTLSQNRFFNIVEVGAGCDGAFFAKIVSSLQLAYRNSWNLDGRARRWSLDAGRWMLTSGLQTFDSGRRTLDCGFWGWTLDAGFWLLDSGRWTLDAGRYTQDASLWALDTVANWFRTISEPSF